MYCQHKLLIILLYGLSVEDVILNNQPKLTNQVVIVLINFPVLLIVQCLEMISVEKKSVNSILLKLPPIRGGVWEVLRSSLSRSVYTWVSRRKNFVD